MKGIIGDVDDLVTTIRHVARAQSQSKKTEAERQAEKILADARQQADHIRQEILNRAQAQAEAEHRQLVAQAIADARHTYLTKREELLNQVWQHAEESLRSLSDEAETYAEVLGQLAQLAAQTLKSEHLILAADPKGHKLLTEKRLEKWGKAASEAGEMSVTFEQAAEPLDAWAGLIIYEADGRRRIDATFSTRLDMARDEIREAIFKQLVQES